MDQLIKRICNLLTIKSIVTLALTAVFAFAVVKQWITADQLLTVFTVVIGFYFGTQAKKE